MMRLRLWLLVPIGAILVVAVLMVPPGMLPAGPGDTFSDASLSHWPNAFFLRESVWQHGQWPLYHPGRMLGQPFAANPLSKVWYPPQWFVLAVPPTLHLNLMVYGHMVLLAAGATLWLHDEGFAPPVIAFGTLALALTPRVPAHLALGHLDIVYAFAWAPWVLRAVYRTAGEPTAHRALELGLFGGMLILADVRIALYVLLTGVVYGLSLLDRAQTARIVAAAAGAGVAALGLTAVQTVPLLALSDSLTRALITPEQAAALSLQPAALIGLLVPDPQGYAERMTHLGVPVLVMAVAALFSRRWQRIWPWAVLVPAAMLWALGSNGPVFLPALRTLPALTWFRVPSRAWFVVILGVVMLSAYGMQHLLENGSTRPHRAASIALLGSGLSVTVAALVAQPALVVTGVVLTFTGVGLLFLNGGFYARFARMLNLRDTSALGGRRALPLIVVLAVSLTAYGLSIVSGLPVASAAVHLPAGSVVYSPSYDLAGPAAERAGLRRVHAIDPFQLRWAAQAVAEAAGTDLTGYSIVAPPVPPGAQSVQMGLSQTTPDIDLLNALGVTHVVAVYPVPGLSSPARSGDFYVYTIGDSTPCTFEVNRVQCDRGQVPLMYAPGWFNGSDPVGRDGPLLDAQGPVELVYRPPAVWAGLALTVSTLIVMGVVWKIA